MIDEEKYKRYLQKREEEFQNFFFNNKKEEEDEKYCTLKRNFDHPLGIVINDKPLGIVIDKTRGNDIQIKMIK